MLLMLLRLLIVLFPIRCIARAGTNRAWPCAFPRIHRIRWDKPADEADRLETLAAMIAD